MGGNLVPLIVAAIGLVVVIAGAAGLWRRRHRVARRPLTEPVCPRCGYAIDDASRPCSECGADLAAVGIRDASWPHRRDFVLRGLFAAMLCLPWIVIVLVLPPTAMPSIRTTRVATFIGVAGEDGLARPVLRIDRRARWIGLGRTPSASPPESAWGRPGLAEAPPDADVMAAPVVATDEARLPAILGDDVYLPADRSTLGTAARAVLPLADRIAGGPSNAAGVIATESPQHLGGGRAGGTTTSSQRGRAVQVDSYAYLPLPPGTVVPVSQRTVSTSRVLLPRREHVPLVAGSALAVLLVRGA